ncbi:hypothetical protein SUGI_0874260 [Cryptomeria japonica]|uniref:ubiquitin C-terminal hydrolase 13 isoform X2 n=1 Tax=Cryptomeria japonica TaxID=3369 RepID=UPI002414AC4D|nr:ubiquitin C-terminal hydrolase 13 isoform X2 [Cryptomeria japonica]GLJ42235.1 hypothetical protein SUGI_0874260 [Cryptomeria japonica]
MSSAQEVSLVTQESTEPELMETGATLSKTSDDSENVEFVWKVHGFPALGTGIVRSDKFKAGDFNWRVLLYPRGCKGQGDQVSVLLELSQEDIDMTSGWPVFVKCYFGVFNHTGQKITIYKQYRHQFSPNSTDWGFGSFASYNVVCDPANGFLCDDALTVIAKVQIYADFSIFDSKEEISLVGLKNQGATCYLNSLLQTLYHIPYFRRAVYHMPMENISSTRIPLALQHLFYNMQSSNDSVSTTELTESFGWSIYDTYQQRDVQEFNRILCNKLEETMKGTSVEGTIQKLFEGHLRNCIECIGMDYKSTNQERFYDLQLDVRGCMDVYSSLDKYIQVEKLEGDNQYKVENVGFQDARKETRFADFPPILQLHLKRFEYDNTRNLLAKINDRYEFPLELDLDKDDGRYLSSDADRSVRNLYSLYSVLVHSGGANAGHYYAFIRPLLSERWYKFNDECVTRQSLETVLDEQYGGEEEISQKKVGDNETVSFPRHSSAYMLVYVRESDKDTIMCKLDDEDIIELLKENDRKQREREEVHFLRNIKENDWKQRDREEVDILKKIKDTMEEQENYLKQRHRKEVSPYTNIKVVCDTHLQTQIGKDVIFDLVDFDKVNTINFKNSMPLSQIKDHFAKEFFIPTNCQRIWIWSKRKNNTWRPRKALTSVDEVLTIGDLKHYSGGSEVRLFLEKQNVQEEQITFSPSAIAREVILLFFKLYDPNEKGLRYIGKQHVKQDSRPMEDLDKFKEMAGLETGEEVVLNEERSFIPKVQCVQVNILKTYKENELQDGDIICLQRSVMEDDKDELHSIEKYFHHVKYYKDVHFRKLDNPEKDVACLELNTLITYDELVRVLVSHLKLDDLSKIRFTPHNVFTEQPGDQPIKRLSVESLKEMLLYHNQMSNILYYEILDMPLSELEKLKVIKVSFYNSKVQEVSSNTITLHHECTVNDVMGHIREKVEMSDQQAELRILQIIGHKIWKILSPNDKIKYMVSQHATFRSQCVTFRAEEIPEEERSKGPEDCVIHVHHFRQDQNNNIENFGEPFLFLTRSGETLGQLKQRVKKKLQVPDHQFSEFKFASVHLSQPAYLNDDDDVNLFKRQAIYGPWEFYLGLQHDDIV